MNVGRPESAIDILTQSWMSKQPFRSESWFRNFVNISYPHIIETLFIGISQRDLVFFCLEDRCRRSESWMRYHISVMSLRTEQTI